MKEYPTILCQQSSSIGGADMVDLLSTAVSAAPGLAALLLRWYDRRKLKPDVRVKPFWGYYEKDVIESGQKGNIRLYLEVFVDNQGRKGTAIKTVVARVPASGGGIMEAEGRPVEKSDRLPVHLKGDGESVLFKMSFDFPNPPLLKQNFITPAALNMIPPASGQSLEVEVIVVHTYKTEKAMYPAYPASSLESKLARNLATSSSTREI
jgi:hypothetical protein